MYVTRLDFLSSLVNVTYASMMDDAYAVSDISLEKIKT